MQHVSDPMHPYSDAPGDTDVSLSKRCQRSNAKEVFEPVAIPMELTTTSFTGRSKAPTGALDDAVKQDTGGAYRDRTDDLLNANQALSQLS